MHSTSTNTSRLESFGVNSLSSTFLCPPHNDTQSSPSDWFQNRVPVCSSALSALSFHLLAVRTAIHLTLLTDIVFDFPKMKVLKEKLRVIGLRFVRSADELLQESRGGGGDRWLKPSEQLFFRSMSERSTDLNPSSPVVPSHVELKCIQTEQTTPIRPN